MKTKKITFCPRCETKLRHVQVSTWSAKQKVLSFQCPKCDYFSFDPITAKKVVDELKKNAPRVRQEITKVIRNKQRVIQKVFP